MSARVNPAPLGESVALQKRAQALLDANKNQDAILYFRAAGNTARAGELEDRLAGVLLQAEFTGKSEFLEFGASNGKRVTLRGGVSAVMKEHDGHYVSHAGAEVAAYRLDRLFDGKFGVPVTVLRKHEGKMYSLQAFVSDAKTTLPNRTSANLKFFDYLIDNLDRYNGTNLLETKDHLLVPIDHGMAFRTAKGGFGSRFGNSAFLASKCSLWIFDALIRKCLRAQVLKLLPERSVYEKLKNLPDKEIRSALHGYVDEIEIQNVLERRDFLVKTVESVK